jgi:hypothetical protein
LLSMTVCDRLSASYAIRGAQYLSLEGTYR